VNQSEKSEFFVPAWQELVSSSLVAVAPRCENGDLCNSNRFLAATALKSLRDNSLCHFFLPLQYAKIAPFRKDFTTDGTDGTDKSRLVRNHFQSVKSVKSAVKFLWFRLRCAGNCAPFCGKSI
jgi:hypothetical protein